MPEAGADCECAARFRSVATSVCVVEEVRSKKDFVGVDAFLKFVQSHSVFTEGELRGWLGSSDRLYVVKMTYNLALFKRPNRDALLEKVGVSGQPRWDLRQFTCVQFNKVVELAQADEGIVVD